MIIEKHDNNAIDLANIREIYSQSNWNMRAFITLRFQHFATFSVILAFISTIAFKIDVFAAYSAYILLFGTLVTFLFWLLDRRTAEYLSYHANKASKIEENLINKHCEIIHVAKMTKPRILSASRITDIIFLIILIGWTAFASAQFWLNGAEIRSKPKTLPEALSIADEMIVKSISILDI